VGAGLANGRDPICAIYPLFNAEASLEIDLTRKNK
jgi:hypothetical protein